VSRGTAIPTHSNAKKEHQQLDRAKNGTSPFLGASVNQKMLGAGKHSSQIIKTCPHCDKTVSAGPFAKYHGDKCKKKTP
jgi:hypothetical protein